MSLPVAVIGGGWAGCAAAVELARAGWEVSLYEASHELGGRARRTELSLSGSRYLLDNGQHLLIGAYSETARLLELVGQPLAQVVESTPFEMFRPRGLALRAARLPAPWHLLWALITARGLTLKTRAQFVAVMQRLKHDRWRIEPDRSVQTWLAENHQPRDLVEKIWSPLTLAALNTPLAVASAQILANVLRDSLGSDARASDMWLPRADLSSLFPDAAAAFIRSHGGEVRVGAMIERVEPRDDAWVVHGREGGHPFAESVAQVIFAAPPMQLARIFAPLASSLRETFDLIAQFRHEPICTIYLKYASGTRLPRRMLALDEQPAKQCFGQWVFDRGALSKDLDGVMAVVISGPGPHEALSLDMLCASIANQLRAELDFPAPLDARAIMEKRATLSAVVNLRRPGKATALAGLALAGDWTDSDYPSTLESALRSGTAAAKWVSHGQ